MHKEFLQIVEDISSLKIQGAQRVASEALRAFMIIKQETEHKYAQVNEFAHELDTAKELLIKTRPTEPLMRNLLNLVYGENAPKSSLIQLVTHINTRHELIQKHLHDVTIFVPNIGAQKIKDKSRVFTHCHSSAVVNTILEARSQGKSIVVLNTETRPRYQGRITATELAKNGIDVYHYVDSAMRLAIKDCDIVLLGCDAIDSNLKLYNKIGSQLVCEVAKQMGKPVYIVTDSWKFDPQNDEEIIEDRADEEVWDNAPDNVFVMNYAFEKINPELVTGIICELGIFSPFEFEKSIRKKYPELF